MASRGLLKEFLADYSRHRARRGRPSADSRRALWRKKILALHGLDTPVPERVVAGHLDRSTPSGAAGLRSQLRRHNSKVPMMKAKLFATALVATALSFSALAADKEVTITGDGQCAKCSLKETTKCQNAIKTADGKTYYLADNKVSKDFHDEVCKETKKVTATGTVKDVDGKMKLTASKIDLAK